ncbi:MAG: hypothetical protein HC859_16275, partial [Bacteroidia bacterium]|nr:hypothetical protein [Bacteroidia bacterium]
RHYDIQRDHHGILWISSNGGIIRFNTHDNTFRSYTQADGLQDNEFNTNASLYSRDGWLYFGGINGFNRFHPDSIKVSEEPVKVVIHSLLIMDKRVPVAERLDVPYNRNDFSVKFGGIEFSTPEKVRYAYRLVGYDKDWNYVNTRREAFYTNLDPGTYRFEIKTANADGIWSSEQTKFAININPPFWKTWWFMSLAVAAIVSMVYAAHRYRLEQSLKVERLRNKIASDLHDEVGSSLTRISIYSELVQNGVEEKEKRAYLKSISDLSRDVVSTMSDIVWSIDNRNDKMGALMIRMKDFAIEVLQAKHIDVTFAIHEIDEHKSLDPAVQQNLYLIFKESVNNIVKHSKATAVTIDLHHNSKGFKLVIHDNGVGIRPDSTSTGHGLRNIQRRAEAIQALFLMENRDGTTISVERHSI